MIEPIKPQSVHPAILAVYRIASGLPYQCDKTFEAANGHTAACTLHEGHDGNHRGTMLGSPCTWPRGFASEEALHYDTPDDPDDLNPEAAQRIRE